MKKCARNLLYEFTYKNILLFKIGISFLFFAETNLKMEKFPLKKGGT